VRPARPRLRLETLEDRVLLDSNPVDVGLLEFRLQGPNDQWDSVNQGVYSAHATVLIGFNPHGARFQSLLAVDHGIRINTTQQLFTITSGTQANPNWLLYLPGGDLTKHAQLFGFRANYDIKPADLAGTTPLTIAGTAVVAPNDPKTVTDSGGGYRFDSLRPGNYVVLQVLPPHVTQVFTSQPASGTDVQAGQTTYAINFGNHQAALGTDFNADTVPDYVRLVPQGAAVEVDLDLMANSTAVGRTDVVGTYDPSQWRPVGVGDFTGNGNPDLLFQSADTRILRYWELHNGRLVGSLDFLDVPVGWTVAGLADLHGQGTADLILLKASTRELIDWVMAAGKNIRTKQPGLLPSGWTVEGGADLTGNGSQDLLMRNQDTGEVVAWSLDGTGEAGQRTVGQIAAGFHLVGSEPFGPTLSTGAYLYWQNDQTGQVVRWQWDYAGGMAQVTADFPLGGPARPGLYLNPFAGSELLVPAAATFVSPPRDTPVNNWLAPVQVEVRDRLGNLVSGVAVSLSLVPRGASQPVDFGPGSVVQATTVDGVATFDRLAVSRRGRYRLVANLGGIEVSSSAFRVS
jgi:hypothetical protein